MAVRSAVEEIQHRVDVPLVAVEPVDPPILVVADQRRLVVREHEPVAGAHHELSIGHVRETAVHRPLTRLGTHGEAVAGLGHQCTERGGGPRLHLGGIVVAQQAQQVALVSLWIGQFVRSRESG